VNAAGLQMRFFTDGSAVCSHLRVPKHLCGWSNIVHGGVITAVLDEVMSWAAIHLLKRIALTQTISVEFLKPVQVGVELRAEGRILETNTKNDAFTEGVLFDARGEVCARSKAGFKVFSPAVARRLGIADAETISWFEGIFTS
jgi:uncharacterized protein (TIGR00369 family)